MAAPAAEHLTPMRFTLDASASRFLSIHPVMFFVAVVIFLWLGTLVGGQLRKRRSHLIPEEAATFKTLESAVLALLGLLLGFTFSMSVSRYDARKNLEIAEANDVIALWLRTAALPEPVRSSEQSLIRQYIPVRMQFLSDGTDDHRIEASLNQTASLQNRMSAIVSAYAQTHTDPVTAGFLTALDSAVGVTESRTAAFENRIPLTAWAMLLLISFIASVLVGIGISSHSQALRLVLPIVVALALSLTLDLDSPRSGLIRVHQYSLARMDTRINAGPLP